jgi:hypothetical protein
MAVWPTGALDIVSEIAPGANPGGDPGVWSWTAISPLVRHKSGASISQGRMNEGNLVDKGSSTLVLDNRSGDFSTKNPLGQWYGLLARNTPFRQRIRPGVFNAISDTYTRTLTSGWGNATTGQTWGTLSVGGTITATDYSVNGTAGVHSVPATSAYRHSRLAAVAEADIEDMRVTCTLAVTAAGNDLEPANLVFRGTTTAAYYMVRPVINATTQTVRLRLFNPAGTQVADVATGVTHAAGTPFTVAVQAIDAQIKAKLWQGAVEPTTWQLLANDSSYVGPGYIGIRSGVASGNTNTKPVLFTYDNFSATFTYTVFEGTVPAWPPRWDKSRKDMTAPIAPAGVLRRLAQGKSPLYSPMYRANILSAPVDYWPLEEGKDATQANNVIPGGAPLVPNLLDFVKFGGLDDALVPAGVATMPQFDGAVLKAQIRGTSTTSWRVEWLCAIELASLTSTPIRQIEWLTNGGITQWWCESSTGGTLIFARSPVIAGLPFGGTVTGGDISDGKVHHYALEVTQSTSTLMPWSLYLDGVLVDSGSNTTGALIGAQQVGAPHDITLNPDGETEILSISQVGVWSPKPAVPVDHAAFNAWVGETAAARLARVFGEQGERITVLPGATETMGPQQRDTFMSIVRECEATDGGVLYEYRFGLAYQPRAARYNAPYALTVDFDNTADVAEPPEPTDDDQRLRNSREVKRKTGSKSAVAVDQASIDLEGLYDDSVTINPASDDVLEQHAYWRLHLGTSDELRWPAIVLDLRARPNLLVPWLKTTVGSRILAQHAPFPAGVGDVDVIQEGWTLDLAPDEAKVTMQCSQGTLYQVAVVEGAGAPAAPPLQVDTSGSSVSTGVNTTATSLTVASTGQIWTTTASRPADFPFYCDFDGEKVQVSAIVGSSSPQTFTVVRSVNGVVKSHLANAPIRLWKPAVIAL